jgi:UDP-N-acetylmuramate: L-alanyl-gamma-D-glutamyl-meso-diaminopimelate ligase
MRIHLIAIGGSAMHNLALALHYNHHTVSGSDDEIYNPARGRLEDAGILPIEEGWYPEKINKDIDIIILGMHARSNNPELEKALSLGIKVLSYPAFVFEHSKDKTRVVIAGSHGKTTTTSMILHVLKSIDSSKYEKDLRFDYLVGAQLDGFDRMVQLSDAPIIIIEGDEYLSSPIDRRPKFLHYKPHISVITGIAWDHINVFSTFESYVEQFKLFLKSIEKGGKVFYFKNDVILRQQVQQFTNIDATSYDGFNSKISNGQTILITDKEVEFPLFIFGQHNLENLKAAYLVCIELGIKEEDFFNAILDFEGAAKRLQLLREEKAFKAFLDFAHAPSKVKATIDALKNQYQERELIACVELHTFSSLSKQFLKEYNGAMDRANLAIVFFSEYTLKMKKLKTILPIDIQAAFNHPNLIVFTDNKKMENYLIDKTWNDKNLLLMTSGTFDGLDLKEVINKLGVNNSVVE